MDRKKHWDITRGIRICRFRRIFPKERNFKKSPYCLEFKRNANLIIRFDDMPNFYTAHQFLLWIKSKIKNEFSGDVGRYWIGGRWNGYKHSRYLFNCPVLMLYYDGVEVRVVKKYSYRQKYGKNRSTSILYEGIRRFRLLKGMTL